MSDKVKDFLRLSHLNHQIQIIVYLGKLSSTVDHAFSSIDLAIDRTSIRMGTAIGHWIDFRAKSGVSSLQLLHMGVGKLEPLTVGSLLNVRNIVPVISLGTNMHQHAGQMESVVVRAGLTAKVIY